MKRETLASFETSSSRGSKRRLLLTRGCCAHHHVHSRRRLQRGRLHEETHVPAAQRPSKTPEGSVQMLGAPPSGGARGV